MRYRFIEQYREQHSIALMCKVLQVSRSGYYAWRKRPESAREMANQELGAEIEQIFKENRKVYGSPRIRRELLALGKRCSRKRVAHQMRKLGLRARCRRKYKVTTQRNAAHEVAPNLLQQDFHAEHPNAKWGRYQLHCQERVKMSRNHRNKKSLFQRGQCPLQSLKNLVIPPAPHLIGCALDDILTHRLTVSFRPIMVQGFHPRRARSFRPKGVFAFGNRSK